MIRFHTFIFQNEVTAHKLNILVVLSEADPNLRG